MKHRFILLAIATTIFASTLVRSDDADLLTGKWSVKKVNEDGQTVTQTIEVKKDKFVFEILSTNDRLLLHAEGDLKLEKLGPFSSARFFRIRAGETIDNLDSVDDEYVSIYALDGETWTLAVNLDKQREQKASLDIYRRIKPNAQPKPASKK